MHREASSPGGQGTFIGHHTVDVSKPCLVLAKKTCGKKKTSMRLVRRTVLYQDGFADPEGVIRDVADGKATCAGCLTDDGFSSPTRQMEGAKSGGKLQLSLISMLPFGFQSRDSSRPGQAINEAGSYVPSVLQCLCKIAASHAHKSPLSRYACTCLLGVKQKLHLLGLPRESSPCSAIEPAARLHVLRTMTYRHLSIQRHG